MINDIESFVNLKMAHINHANNKNLALHSINVAKLLFQFNCEELVVKSGYFHSAYGREFTQFNAIDWTDRDMLRETIGTDAENLCYLNCIMSHRSFWLNFHERKLTEKESLFLENRIDKTLIPVGAKTLLDLLVVNFANMMDHIDPHQGLDHFKSAELSLYLQYFNLLPEKSQKYFTETFGIL